MPFLNINKETAFSVLFISSLTAALFFTGINTWLFTASFLFLSTQLGLVFIQRYNNELPIKINGLVIVCLLFLIWFTILIFLAPIKYLSIYNLFWVGSLYIVFLLFTFQNNKDELWNKTWPAILLLVVIWAIYGLVQYYVLHVASNASFLNRNSLAALISLILLPTSGYFLLSAKERPWLFLNNIVLSVSLFILFLTIFIITSRGATLSVLGGFVILIILLKNQLNKNQLLLLFAIIIFAFSFSVASQYFITHLPESFGERMASLKDTSAAGNARFIIWNSMLPLFNEMPWYGFGLGSLWVFWPPHRPAADTSAGFFAHNDYIQITLESGYPGIILLTALFSFLLLYFIKALRNSKTLSTLQRVEVVSLFSAMASFIAHSALTYNFYVLPLVIIVGLYLARFNQLTTITSNTKTLAPLKHYFKPITYIISALGIVIILFSYFVSVSLSSHYNNRAQKLMLKGQYQESNANYQLAQRLAPLMDNPFFSRADLLRRGANKLYHVNKNRQADSLIKLAHTQLDTAEKLHPFRAQTHHIRGLIFERNNSLAAKNEYRKALKLDPRFLFSRIRLAKLLHKQGNLKQAIEVLYAGVDYNYPVNSIMLEYMRFFAKLSHAAGGKSFALHLEKNIKNFMSKKQK